MRVVVGNIVVEDGYCQECKRAIVFCPHWDEYDKEIRKRLEECRAKQPKNPMKPGDKAFFSS